MWSKTAKRPTVPTRPGVIYNRILAVLLALALVGGSFSGVAAAADDVVNSVYITTSEQEPGQLYVDDNSIILNAYASMSISGEKNVTEDATWSSTSSAIKVSKGVVTATGAVSSATITVRYKEKTDTFMVTSEPYFEELKLKLDSSDAPEKKEVELGEELQLKASGTRGTGSTEDVTSTATWTTSDANVATVEKGKVKLVSAGEAKITAKSKGKTDSIELKIKSPYKEIKFKSADDTTLQGPVEMYIGGPVQALKAVATLNSGTEQTVTDDADWTSSNAAVVKVDEDGKLTAVGKGTAVITAKHNGASGTITVIVKTQYEALKISPNNSIYVTLYGSRVELTATANSGNLENGPENVTSLAEWKISDSDQAVAVIRQENDKVYVQPNGTGTATINVSYLGLSRSVSVTVFPTIESFKVDKTEMDVYVDDDGTLPGLTGTTVAEETKDVSKLAQWTSSNTDVVSIEDGKWKAEGPGKAVLTATIESVEGKNIEATVDVTVHNKILALIPEQDTMSVVIGKEAELPKIRLIYENGDEVSGEELADQIVWKSSTPNLLVKKDTMKGLLAANATLTGTYLNKTVKVKVTVEEEFTSFEIAPTTVSVTLNKSKSIKVTGTTKSGKKVSLGSRVSWKASNEEHVSIKGASVKGLTEGSGKLTATVQGKTLEVPYVVTAKLTKLTASDTSFKAAAVGSQLSVQLTALYETGKTENVTTKATWTSSKASVATVADGKISVKGKGTVSIKGSFGGKTVTIRVTVK
ncbi:Ig domain-containing protein [Cohnella cellulosilytica]|uniref:Ig domain-containing protein n=2 Tax=Cohnella cellulosilytica TaxID=986710 RepID=A0ABW2FK09_9BACL